MAEALILSDLFQMDELAAVELLMAGNNCFCVNFFVLYKSKIVRQRLFS